MKLKLILLLSILLFIVACVSEAPEPATEQVNLEPTPESGRSTEVLPSEVPEILPPEVQAEEPSTLDDWHYQLQDATFSSVRELQTAYVIVDIDDIDLSAEQLGVLHQQGKTIFSYLSIGEAEDYREYWQDGWRVGSPSFIDAENPGWEGNFKVKYWDLGWQEIILAKVEMIAEQGYDGVYLDIIDAYEYYEEQGRETAAQEMIDFVRKIREASQQINPSFLIVPQNAAELYTFEEYRQIIDGFGKEDTWFDDDEEISDDSSLSFLDQAVRDGKFVLAVDYPTIEKKICEFYKECNSHGFYCTVSDRDLDLSEPIFCGD
ncbi:hypothetical protein COV20_02785 [Candidatus Woesearchaeota archaeon CG10_big_fil_rev_8_21_14_0_10_45_16]|nr:MAG: hypothetical protein COV20_02785 [Candidatus Woesearchaeota archaeon CG10_big_fil_rev_8_21_14_0_10_45_16]